MTEQLELTTRSKLNKALESGFPTKYPWHEIGEAILIEYEAGESPLTLSAKYGIAKSAISSFLGRAGVRRTKKHAKQVERDQQRGRTHAPRTCVSCGDVFEPEGPTQKHCKGCAPNDTARTRLCSKGVSQKDWDRMFLEQGGLCALCDKLATDVDHDHATLIIRGLLCGGCNQALSHVDRPGWVAKAQMYLKRDTGHRVPVEAHAQWATGMARIYAKRRASL